LRIVHGILLFWMIMQVIAAERVLPHVQQVLKPAFLPTFAVASVVAVGVALWAKIGRIRPALETLELTPDDALALQRWRFGAILLFVMFETLVGYGFALRSLGGTLLESAPFYAVGHWPDAALLAAATITLLVSAFSLTDRYLLRYRSNGFPRCWAAGAL
jgi:hypothetical protein